MWNGSFAPRVKLFFSHNYLAFDNRCIMPATQQPDSNKTGENNILTPQTFHSVSSLRSRFLSGVLRTPKIKTTQENDMYTYLSTIQFDMAHEGYEAQQEYVHHLRCLVSLPGGYVEEPHFLECIRELAEFKQYLSTVREAA